MKAKTKPLYYGDYLQLDKLLNIQSLKSLEIGKPAHEEMLFIIVHQAYELWFKEVLHELDSVRDIFAQEFIPEKDVCVVLRRLKRITEIQKLVNDQIRVLETMSPMEFMGFRDFLFPASGFQSFQFRLIEIKLGLQLDDRVHYDQKAYYTRLSKEHQDLILRTEQESSLFDLIQKWLERTPFLKVEEFDFWNAYRQAVTKMLDDDRGVIQSNPHLNDEVVALELKELDKTVESFETLFDAARHTELVVRGNHRLSHDATKAALLILLYRDEPILQLPYQLLVVLQDIDELWAEWRNRHALMVNRMIGSKIGTGGSSGYQYLKTTAEKHRIFNDFARLSTYMIPAAALPELPPEVKKQLDFYYQSTTDR